MIDILDFYREVMILLSEPVAFSKQLHLDMHWIKEKILANGDCHENLCHCCVRVAKVLKRRLADSVHNRMVLGPQNKSTIMYIKFCENLSSRKMKTTRY